MSASQPAIPQPLATFVETDRDGHVSFCYPIESGYLQATLRSLHEDMRCALSLKGAARQAAFEAVAVEIAKARDFHEHIHAQWDRFTDARALAQQVAGASL
jgi:PleD family two-component response regulator